MDRKRAHLRLALLATGMSLVPHAAHAQTTQTGVDVSASAEAVNNPYLSNQDSAWLGAGTVEVRPWLRRADETESIQFRGLVRARAFTGRFDVETAFGGDVGVTSRLNARTSAYGNASILSSSRRTPFDLLTPRPGLTDAIVPLPDTVPIAEPIVVLPGEDITVLGDLGRITTSSIGAGLSHQLDPNSALGYSVGYSRLDGDSDSTGIGYERASLGTSFSRRLSPRAQIGISGSAGRTRFEEGRPSVNSFSLSGNWAQQLGRYWSLSLSAGVSSIEADGNALFPGYSSVSPIASVSICNQPVRKNFCASYSRAQQPSFLGDVRTSDALGLSYSEQLSQQRRVDLSASYSRSEGDEDAASLFDEVEAVSLRGVFSQTLNDRTEGYISGSVAKTYGGFQSREPSIAFGVGVRLRLGERR